MVCIVTVITYIFLLQRFPLIMVTVMIFTLLYYTTHFIRFKTIFLFAVIGVLIFFSIATLRSGQFIQFALYKASLMKFSPQYAIFTEPYMYVVMNIENFVHAVSKLQYNTFGYYSFDFIFSLVQLKYPLKEYFGLVDTPYQIGGYNTHTMFWTFYRDFGILGISLVPFVGGLSVGTLYKAMRTKPTIELVTFYSIVVFVMTLSFFLSPLGYLWFIYVIVWIMMILRLIRIRSDQ